MSARVPRPRPQLGQRGRSTLTPTPPHPDNHTCPRPIDIVVKYDHYCDKSTIDPFTGETHPCPWVTQSKTSEGFDCNDPWYVVTPTQNPKRKQKRKQGGQTNLLRLRYSATGNCFPSTECPSGECRLAQLGGCWACCLCGGQGNAYNWCKSRIKPETNPATCSLLLCRLSKFPSTNRCLGIPPVPQHHMYDEKGVDEASSMPTLPR